MAQNITLLGASYSDVPSVELPKTGGGTAQFDDTTIASNAASASDITSGKLAFVNGLLITGTASGGGGGLEYETGTWTPASNTSNTTISFSDSHDVAPAFYTLADTTNEYYSTEYSIYSITYYNHEQLCGAVIDQSESSMIYGEVRIRYRTTNTTTITGAIVSLNHSYTESGASDNTYPGYWARSTGFTAYSNSSSRYWRAGRTYKWIAVWAPTS